MPYIIWSVIYHLITISFDHYIIWSVIYRLISYSVRWTSYTIPPFLPFKPSFLHPSFPSNLLFPTPFPLFLLLKPFFFSTAQIILYRMCLKPEAYISCLRCIQVWLLAYINHVILYSIHTIYTLYTKHFFCSVSKHPLPSFPVSNHSPNVSCLRCFRVWADLLGNRSYNSQYRCERRMIYTHSPYTPFTHIIHIIRLIHPIHPIKPYSYTPYTPYS